MKQIAVLLVGHTDVDVKRVSAAIAAAQSSAQLHDLILVEAARIDYGNHPMQSPDPVEIEEIIRVFKESIIPVPKFQAAERSPLPQKFSGTHKDLHRPLPKKQPPDPRRLSRRPFLK